MKKATRYVVSMAMVVLLLLGVLPAIALRSEANSTASAQPASLSLGVENIVKRARQMTQIQWTPQKNITGWGNGVTYYAGITYTGLPYGQPVYADYVPWEISLDGFLTAVNDQNSKMYTEQSSYNKVAPYYSIDCSAFVSWAWGLDSRKTTVSIPQAATKISDSSYASMEVGDCLCKSGHHTVLVTDIQYSSSGDIIAVEISEATTDSVNYLCHSIWFGEGHGKSMSAFQNKYLDSGYILYRCKTRDSVTYTHSCASPLEGDTCSSCQPLQENQEEPSYFGIDVSHWQGEIDWEKVAPQIDFAFVRCGYGSDIAAQDDRYWHQNASACSRLGIPWGVFLYSYALTDEQALSEAKHVLRLLEGYDPQLPVFLDLESTKQLENCSAEDILRYAKIFCDEIEAAGYTPGIYANRDWWLNHLTSPEYDQWVRWIARYNPIGPEYDKEYTIWQYSETGTLDGINGNVDLDYWYGSLPDTQEHVHSYTSSIIQEAICTQDGLRTYTCECGHTYDEVIPATGHSFTDGHCVHCGETDPNIVKGDLNGDGTVSTADAVLLARYLADLIGLNPVQVIAADVNADGTVSSADAVTIAKFLAGLSPVL